MDLNSMTRAELTRLRNDVEKALSTLAERERKAARSAAEKVAADHGFTLDQLTETASPRGKRGKAKAPARYRNPADANKTWTGRGRRPDWINEALAAGKSLSDFEI